MWLYTRGYLFGDLGPSRREETIWSVVNLRRAMSFTCSRGWTCHIPMGRTRQFHSSMVSKRFKDVFISTLDDHPGISAINHTRSLFMFFSVAAPSFAMFGRRFRCEGFGRCLWQRLGSVDPGVSPTHGEAGNQKQQVHFKLKTEGKHLHTWNYLKLKSLY